MKISNMFWVIAWIVSVSFAANSAFPESTREFCSAVQAMHEQCTNIDTVNLGQRGKAGPRGEKGEKGSPGVVDNSQISFLLKQSLEASAPLGSVNNPAPNCYEIKNATISELASGLYHIKDIEGNTFQTYCDMATDQGGWTLVASVHENNIKGRCTSGDRWSSEQGNSAGHPHGDGFWENRATHGHASSSTSDDYKNSAYFNMNARDIMIWHVPNDTPMERYESAAFIKYHTSNGFLQSYGGNLGSLFSNHFNMRSKQFQTYTDNGPAISIIWDRGSNNEMMEFHGANTKLEIEPGYIQFRAINYERNAFALCSGVRIKAGKGDVEHACFGSTSNNIGHTNEEEYCGDLSAADWSHGDGWRTKPRLHNSAILIFYR